MRHSGTAGYLDWQRSAWAPFGRRHGDFVVDRGGTGVARIFVCGGGTRPTQLSLTSVMHTFEAVAGKWGSVSAPAVSRVIGGAPERKKSDFF